MLLPGARRAFERDQVEGLFDETTIGQLAGLLYEFDSHGRMKIESKDNARERGVPSPDRADALMLALCKAPYESLAASLAFTRRGQYPGSSPHDRRAEELEREQRMDGGQRYTNPSRFSHVKGAW
jgi:hypothetical protein